MLWLGESAVDVWLSMTSWWCAGGGRGRGGKRNSPKPDGKFKAERGSNTPTPPAAAGAGAGAPATMSLRIKARREAAAAAAGTDGFVPAAQHSSPMAGVYSSNDGPGSPFVGASGAAAKPSSRLGRSPTPGAFRSEASPALEGQPPPKKRARTSVIVRPRAGLRGAAEQRTGGGEGQPPLPPPTQEPDGARISNSGGELMEQFQAGEKGGSEGGFRVREAAEGAASGVWEHQAVAGNAAAENGFVTVSAATTAVAAAGEVAGGGLVALGSGTGSGSGVFSGLLGGLKEAGSLGDSSFNGVGVQEQGQEKAGEPPAAAAQGTGLPAASLRNGYVVGVPQLAPSPAPAAFGPDSGRSAAAAALSSSVAGTASLSIMRAAAGVAAGRVDGGAATSSAAVGGALATAGSGGSRSSGEGDAPGLPALPQQQYAAQAPWSVGMTKKQSAAVYEAVKLHLVAHLQVREGGKGRGRGGGRREAGRVTLSRLR